MILVLGLITALSGSLAPASALPVSAAAAGQGADGTPGAQDAPTPVFVSPTADAGDDQSVDEGTVVTLDATRSKSSNLVTRTYTTSADFAEGSSINLTDTPPDQLRLDDTTGAFEFIWIAASNRGTVVKIDTATGTVLGEYWSAPQNRSKDPSRTTVDHNGNVWVGNRAEGSAVGGVAKGSVTQIGLVENGQCVDRNGNGVIDTSTGLGNIKAWPNAAPSPDTNGGVDTALDECIINYVRTNGVAIRQVSVDADNHVWVGGAAQGGNPSWFDRLAPDGTIVRSINMRSPAATGESGVVVCCYGGLVDPAGILWSSSGSNNLVRLDPSQPNGSPNLITNINLGRTSYGLGIDPDGFLWQSNWTANTVQKISPAGAIVGTFGTAGGGNDRGVAATAEGDVWVANSGGNSVSRLRNNGTLITTIPVGSQPTGVAVDAAGKVWATNLGSSTASRINPATNTVDLTVSLGAGAGPYNYSDMTGSTLTGAPDDGTWSVVYDSGAADTPWAFLDWATQLPGDASFTVSVASSANGVTFGPEVAVTDEEEIAGLANGRYLRVTARFTRATTGESPVLFDLTVAHAGDRANTLAYQWRLVDIDGPPVFLSSATSATPSFVAPDDATYTFELTVTDSAGLSDTDEVTVTVNNLDPAVEAEIGSAFARGVTLVNASFTDPGWLDVHSATFDWGDGTAVEPTDVTAQGTGWGSFFGSHVYASAGNYHVTVTLTDDDGGSDAVDLGQVSVAEPVAVWANSQTAAKTFEWTGGGGSITGRVHSNREVKIAGTLPKSIIGPTEYVTTITVSGPHTVTPVQSTVQPFPVVYNLADYAPGGRVAVQVGAAYFNHAADCVKGLWDVGSQTLPVGVHYAPCSIKVNGSSIGGRITLAATGSIELSGSQPALEPYHDGLLLLAGASGNKAINVSASSTKFLGVIFAGAGEVSLSGSNSTFFCGIYGDRVSASGSNLTLRSSQCGRPDSTISGPLLVPGLELSLAADPEETLPGGQIDYDLQVSNNGSLLIVPGLIGLENVDTSPATVTGITYAFEYFSVATGTWTPIASLADGKVALEPHANPSAGVTYPAPDQIVGTVVGAGGFATWGYQALVELTPAQVDLLLDPTRVGGFRNRVEFTLTPSTVQVRRLFTFGTDFIGAIRALSGDITDPSVTFLPPAGDLVVADATSHPAMAVLTPGETVNLSESFTVPVPAPRSASETDAGYLARLRVLDGSLLVASSFALAQGGVGRLVAPLASATTIEQLPIVSLSTTGPASMPAGTTAQFDLDLVNQGSATASGVALTASAAGSPLTVSGAPASLAAGELATAATAYTAPTLNPPADVTVAGEVAWSDAAGNDYGPVGSDQTTQILTAATLSAILVDTLQTDVGGDGQASPGDTVRYTFTISNHGGQPLTGVSASATPDANSALVVGSVAAAGATVGTGNGAGDTAVAVSYASIAGGSTASFTFHAVVDDPFPTGVSRIEVAGEVTATGFDSVASDDPALPGLADPTRTTVVVPAPNLIASLSGRLQLDPDGNGFPSAGDTLRYELVVASVGSLTVNGVGVTVPTPAGTTLVGGSVTTTTGTVQGGPDVDVALDSLAFLDAATIGFDLLIANPVPTGQTAVTAQGTVASDEIADLLTDDPHTIVDGDATVITIGAGSGGGGGGDTPGIPGPTIGTVSPAEGTVITEPIDIGATLTPPAGETVTEWTVSYRLEGDSQRTALASGTGTTVTATIDPTVMPNGAYVIEVRAEGSAGGVSVAETSIVVEGALKLGRYVTTYQDLSVGVAGLPMQVLRKYDSFDKSVGDFGVGWTLELSNFKVATNGPLGQGGWRMFGCGAGLIFVPLCFESSSPHYVAVTWPDGRVERFDLTPAKGSTFLPGLTSAKFTAKLRTTSTLEAVDSSLYFSNGDLLGGFFGSGGVYDPQRFRLTASNGTVYLLDRTAGLISATDRNGDTLTVGPDGIVSSRGRSITFERDPQGRIKKVTGPESETILYAYDAAGDLKSVTDPNGRVVTYEYESGHYLKLTRDPLNRPFQTLTYVNGRLTSVTDALDNEVQIDVDPDARTETIVDPEGRLTTISTLDERGNVLERKEIFDGKTAITSFTYDEFDNIETRTDPNGDTWEGVYDERNLRLFTLPTQETIEIVYDEFDLPILWKQPRGGETEYHWNSAGQLMAIVDAYEKAETYTYVGGDRKTRTDRENNTWNYDYFPDGKIRSISDPIDHQTSYTYDDSGRLLTETDATDRTTAYTYWPDGTLKTQTAPGGLVTAFTYNELGLISTRVDAAGKTTRWEYDDAGQVRKMIDPLARETLYTFDKGGRLKSTTAPDGGVTTHTYDGAGRLETVKDPVNRLTTYTYDLAGRVASVENAAGGITEYEYDDAGRQILIRDPLNHETEQTYDDDGNLATILDPRDNVTRYEYDLADRLFKVTDATEGITLTGYDFNSRVITTTNPELETTTTSYDPAGRIGSIRNDLGHQTTYGYDDAGRLLTTTDPLSHTETRAYDPAGRLATVDTASGITTTYTYDPRGMVATVANELGQTITYTYDDAGQLATARDPRSHTTSYTYDPVGRLATIKDPKNAVVGLGYNLAGEQTSITDARNKVWTATYDDLGGIATTTDPLDRETLAIYNVAGQLEQATDARGVATAFDYDDAGNLTQVASSPAAINYTYDDLDRRKTMDGGPGLTTWDYDGASRITSVHAPAGTVDYTYDDAGRRTMMTLPSGTVTYGYFDDGRLASVSEPTIGSFGFTYLPDGRPQSLTRPNGVTSTDGYDAAGRLTSVSHTRGAATLASFTYVLDENGNRRAASSAAGTETYTINELNQLTKVTLPGGSAIDYAYDAAGNRSTRTAGGSTTTYTYDDASQLTAVGGAPYTYDASGNRLTGGGSTFTYDSLGRLDSAMVGGSTTTYTLDGDGRRVASTTGGTTTPYLWDMGAPFEELASDGTRTYLHAGGQLLAEQTASSVAYALADALGSVRAITDATGTVTGTALFDAFGAKTAQTGATSIYGFTGEMSDPTGIFLRARTLDPTTGTFLQSDPSRPGAPGVVGYNLYSYVGNNPTTWTDPSGATAITGSVPLYRNVALVAAAGAYTTGLAISAAMLRLALLLAIPIGFTCTVMCDVFVPPTTVGNPPIDTKPLTDKLLESLRRAGEMEITRTIAETIVATCVASKVASLIGDVESLCSGRKMPVFFTGGDVLAATAHDAAAIVFEGQKPLLSVLRNGPPGLPRAWYRQVQYGQPCVPPKGNKIHCDEYPYYSTAEAGPGASLWKIPAQPNRDQGNRLQLFYGFTAKGCKLPDTTPYAVVPIPVPGIPTTWSCR